MRDNRNNAPKDDQRELMRHIDYTQFNGFGFRIQPKERRRKVVKKNTSRIGGSKARKILRGQQ